MADAQVGKGAELLPICAQPGCRIIARPEQPLCDQHAVQQRLLAARRKLAEHAPMAADALIELCDKAEAADVRRRAAEAILDRIGIRSGVELGVTHEGTGPLASEIIHARLEALRQASAARAEVRDGGEDPDVGTHCPDSEVVASGVERQ